MEVSFGSRVSNVEMVGECSAGLGATELVRSIWDCQQHLASELQSPDRMFTTDFYQSCLSENVILYEMVNDDI